MIQPRGNCDVYAGDGDAPGVREDRLLREKQQQQAISAMADLIGHTRASRAKARL
jgi:hypothetical protein